ncbi:uncharacterized protein A1O9_09968 [Exophiala aquamarina CBS 119918]|uniref:Uncharacterized protein n=1 Tax=Exophiala aquamarina CBS 119918 TaxID=1182545 RepID=A0A072P4I5_9EURO|nr:uncharacterized protein A1O9_09968 [Exophiala aquamarina CBS 119918]KEF54173.1 hypothetical protein A1O9_09968 [Exophiala aquamarina CBS 119918]
MLLSRLPPVLLAIVAYLFSMSYAQSPCGTDQNPYCAGNDLFEQICCSYPNVCYWANRDGQPACCPYGQVCDGIAPYTTRTITIPPSTITTIRPTTITTAPPLSTVTSYVSGGGIVVVTVTNPPQTSTTYISGWCKDGPCSTVTSGVVGVYSTITSGVVGVYSTVTQEVGQAYSSVSGVLVGNGASRTTASATWILVVGIVLNIAWNGAG